MTGKTNRRAANAAARVSLPDCCRSERGNGSRPERRAQAAAAQGAFGPRSFRVARFLIASRAPSLIDLLDEVGAAWPGLNYADFHGAYVLSDILIRFPSQIRTIAEGMPPPGDDPLAWLDRIIALTTPAGGRA
jgi:hypothetical protein